MERCVEVYSWGNNYWRCLFHWDTIRTERVWTPRRIDRFDPNLDITTYELMNADAAVCKDRDGCLYTFGRNNGRLGHGKVKDYLKPKLVLALQNEKIIQVASSSRHVLFRSATGLFGCGSNSSMQAIGRSGRDVLTPLLITAKGLDKMGCSIALCGNRFSGIVSASRNQIWCWGMNTAGVLGNGFDLYTAYPPLEALIGMDPVVQSFSCGEYHCLVLTRKNEKRKGEWTWGSNSQGQLGIDANNILKQPIAVKLTRRRVAFCPSNCVRWNAFGCDYGRWFFVHVGME